MGGRSRNLWISGPVSALAGGHGAVKQSNLRLVEPAEDAPQAAQVIARWNSWAQVQFPDTQETMWVNLDEIEYEAAAQG